MGAALGEDTHGFMSYAGVAAGDEGGLTREIHAAGDFLGSGTGVIRAYGEAGIDNDRIFAAATDQ